MSKNAIFLGANSDIAKQMLPLFMNDGYTVMRHSRGPFTITPGFKWDLLVCFMGRVAPVGLWHDVDMDDWRECINSNLIEPFRLLQLAWPHRAENATVCFFAGSNPQMIMPGYSAYNTGKMGLLKLVEQLDAETPDAKFFALGPGIVLTKIHDPSAGWDNPKLAAAKAQGKSTPVEEIYGCLNFCAELPKDIIGGRNICVSDWNNYGSNLRLIYELEQRPKMFKLRRVE